MKVLSFRDLKPVKGIPYSRVHVGRLERAGRFPRRVHLGPNSVGWLEAEVEKWLRERVEARAELPTPADAA